MSYADKMNMRATSQLMADAQEFPASQFRVHAMMAAFVTGIAPRGNVRDKCLAIHGGGH